MSLACLKVSTSSYSYSLAPTIPVANLTKTTTAKPGAGEKPPGQRLISWKPNILPWYHLVNLRVFWWAGLKGRLITANSPNSCHQNCLFLEPTCNGVLAVYCNFLPLCLEHGRTGKDGRQQHLWQCRCSIVQKTDQNSSFKDHILQHVEKCN